MTTLRYKLFEAVLRLTGAKNSIGKALEQGHVPSVGVPSKLASRWETTSFDGRDVFVCSPNGKRVEDTGRVYVHHHGGAYAIGLIALHFATMTKLADMSGVTVMLPDYPLPPEQNAKAIIGWASAHYDSVVAEYGAEAVKLGGDSAGGNLALAVCQTTSVSRALLLMSPWVDLEAADLVDDMPHHDILLEPVTIKSAGHRYAGELGASNPLISPLFAATDALPDVAIFTGEKDLLHPSIMRFSEKMKAAGKLQKLATYGEFGHYWMFYPTPDRDSTLVEMAAIIASEHGDALVL